MVSEKMLPNLDKKFKRRKLLLNLKECPMLSLRKGNLALKELQLSIFQARWNQ
jgi:hypothetical protein